VASSPVLVPSTPYSSKTDSSVSMKGGFNVRDCGLTNGHCPSFVTFEHLFFNPSSPLPADPPPPLILTPVLSFGYCFTPTRHRSILGAAGHIIVTPANQLIVIGLKIWPLSNLSNQRPVDHWPNALTNCSNRAYQTPVSCKGGFNVDTVA
jgi:hypothetical protein